MNRVTHCTALGAFNQLFPRTVPPPKPTQAEGGVILRVRLGSTAKLLALSPDVAYQGAAITSAEYHGHGTSSLRTFPVTAAG
jgi:hypothetical protein